MCTAISFPSSPHLFGRNLDLDRRYEEKIVCQPRGLEFPFRYVSQPKEKLAFFGAASVVNGVPLFYDAVNEAGLYAAGLNFPESTAYAELKKDRRDLLPHELIPFILSSCGSVREAWDKLSVLRLTGENFSDKYPAARLHFFIADSKEAMAAEPIGERIELSKNPANVLTNEPPLTAQLEGLYETVPEIKKDRLLTYPEISASPRSEARFIRASVGLKMAARGTNESSAINQLFHLLAHVAVIEGTAKVSRYHKTVYTSVASYASLSYHYSTYENPKIKTVTFTEDDLQSNELKMRPMFFT